MVFFVSPESKTAYRFRCWNRCGGS